MAIDIEQTLKVNAPPDLVWNWLLDAQNVVSALPGAKLVEVTDDRHFVGQMKVRVGTVSVTYKGKIELTEVDEVARHVKVEGKWKEKAGAGSAKMAIDGQVKGEDGVSVITFNGSATVVGKIVQFGRGMIEGVSEELFDQFASKVKKQLEAKAAAAEGPAAEGAEAGAAPPAADQPPAKAEEEEEEALAAIPLLLKVIWKRIKRFFARLFGGGSQR